MHIFCTHLGRVVLVASGTDGHIVSWKAVQPELLGPDTRLPLNGPRRYGFVKHCAMHRAAEFRVIVDECSTADMVAADMPLDDEELRMAGA